MKDKEKQIEEINESELTEIANIIVKTDFDYRGMCWQENSFVRCPYGEPINCQSCLTAKNILDLGYRKIDKNSVVLSKEEYEQWYKGNEFLDKVFERAKAQERKETAEKFLQLAYDRCLEKRFIKKVEELAKQYGVEIKE